MCVAAGQGNVHRHLRASESMPRRKRSCVSDREEKEGPPGAQGEVAMRTYAFYVLQTFHRLCKTSESVRPLEMGEGWEGGGGGKEN